MQRVAVALLASTSAIAAANVKHYPPVSSSINNLDLVLNGTGAPGIYNASQTPESLYGTYNWCNMPHVRAREYKYVFLLFTSLSHPLKKVQETTLELYVGVCGSDPTASQAYTL
jgi:hypothetical protein